MTDDKRHDGLEILSNVSGIPKDDIREIWSEVKRNHALLAACPGHHFSVERVNMGQKVTCDRCRGWLSVTDAAWYVRGYIAAGGDPSDVWPAYAREVRKQ